MTKNSSRTKKPKWLRKLERESWQAELLISGATIIGLLKLPDYMLAFLENIVFESTALTSTFLLILAHYLLIGVYALVICFIFHFAVRALWIALLGLNSVFPDGIQIKPYFNTSEGVLRRIKKEFPNIGDYNNRLDRLGSVMFAIAFGFVMMFLSITFLVFILGVILNLVHFVFPNVFDHIMFIAIVLYVIIFLPIVFVSLFRKFKAGSEEKMDSIQFKITKAYGLAFYNIFYKPVSYILYTLVTNFSFRSTMIGMFIGMFVSGGIAIKKINSVENLDQLISRSRYINFNQLGDFHYKWNYRDKIDVNKNQITPSIQSDIISGPYIKLFIPFIKRELYVMEESEPLIVINGTLEERDSLRKLQLQQYKNFNKILLNDAPLSDLDFMKQEVGNTDGMIAFIPTFYCNQGKNILKIEKQMFHDSIQKKVLIPFFYHSE